MNKYQVALNIFCEQNTFKDISKDVLNENYKLLQELVNNPPLKFEDLHEGIWVWDDINKLYVQIDEDFDKGNGNISVVFREDFYNSNCERTKFGENRFYRREV